MGAYSGFVSGHGFSRAASREPSLGFSPWGFEVKMRLSPFQPESDNGVSYNFAGRQGKRSDIIMVKRPR